MIPRAGELTRLRATQEAHMADTCQILAQGSSPDAYGNPAETFTPGSSISCGFKPTSKREIQEGGQVVMAEAEIRLPNATTITSLDRIRLTHRFGVALASSEDYEVIGQPAQGPSGLVAMVRMVSDG